MKTDEVNAAVEIKTGNMNAAIHCYYKRQERNEHPSGGFDNAGRWYPDEEEKCDCCYGLRAPSRAFPYPLMTHCRTINHVANLFGVDATQMKRHILSFNKLKKEVEEENNMPKRDYSHASIRLFLSA